MGELAAGLAERFSYPGDAAELTRVSQYVATMQGSGPLWDELHALLRARRAADTVHRFFASLPPLLRERGAPHQLIVTTSYDLALEQALRDAGEEFDVVSYIASGRHRGRFCHLAPDGTASPIELPEHVRLGALAGAAHVILKLHGRFDPLARSANGRASSSRRTTTSSTWRSRTSRPRCRSGSRRGSSRSHFLFLGYHVADWNLRVVLQAALGRPPPELPLVGRTAGPEAARAGVLAPASTSTCSHVAARRVRRAARPSGRRGRTGMNAPDGPYKGLAPFGDSDLDALLFFGRGRDSEIMVANLLASRLTVLYGASGVGKSSAASSGRRSHAARGCRGSPARGGRLLAVERAAERGARSAPGRRRRTRRAGLADSLPPGARS